MSLIKSVADDQNTILADIIRLYCPKGFDLDPTFSKGVFYKSGAIPQPKYKSDLYPQDAQTVKSEASDLAWLKEPITSIIFDPPFVAGHTKAKPTGIIGERFHGFPYIKNLWAWYDKCLAEFARVLPRGGVLVVKCQDTVSGGKQYMSHVHIINVAEKLGFYTKDLFVLVAKSRLIGHNHSNQQHARKFHSYFLVFTKT